MAKKKKTKKINVFVLSVRSKNGDVIDVIPGSHYDDLLLQGMELAKIHRGYWEVFNMGGRRIDGNFDWRFLGR